MSAVIVLSEPEKVCYRPGEAIRGTAQWSGSPSTKSVQLLLFYHTEGKGTRDVVIQESITFDNLSTMDSQAFEFTLPSQPWSFSGRLLSVRWALELVVKGAKRKEKELAQVGLLVSPTGKEITLYDHEALPDPKEEKKTWFGFTRSQ